MTECYSDQYMDKAGVGVVMTLSAPASGSVSFNVGSAPHVVDVFATEASRFPPRSTCGVATGTRSSARLRPHTRSPIPTAARHVLVLVRQAGTPFGMRRQPPVPGNARRTRLHPDRLRPPPAMPTAEAADDRALVAAAQAGDGDALDTLLRRHYDRVHAICRRIAGSRRDADDAAQEAMISIVRGLARFDGRARRSRRGPTGSPPTRPSTSCASGTGGRPRTWTPRAGAPRSHRSDVATAGRRHRRSPGDRRGTRRTA